MPDPSPPAPRPVSPRISRPTGSSLPAKGGSSHRLREHEAGDCFFLGLGRVDGTVGWGVDRMLVDMEVFLQETEGDTGCLA